jgi:hypothetical protein
LKSTLSEISIATLACFQGPLAWKIFFQPFTLSQCLFLSVRWVSCKQQIIRSSFLIQFAKRCLLMGMSSPLAFSVSIDRYVWLLPLICFYCLRTWLCTTISVLLSDYLSFLLMWFDTSHSLIVLFAFIFCVQNSS